MHLAVVNLQSFAQLTANGIFRGSAIGLLGVAFALILGVAGRFHFAFGSFYALSAYLAYTFARRGVMPPFVEMMLPFWPAAFVAVLVVAVLAVGVERYIYQPLARQAGVNALLAIFVAALGLGIALENLIRLVWGSASQPYFGPTQERWSIWRVSFVNFDVYQLIIYAALVIALSALLRFTPLGRMLRATRSNPDLAMTIGINSSHVYMIVFFIGTLLAGVVAVWQGIQFTVEPAMGARPVIYAFVVAFLAGTASSPVKIFLTGIGLVTVEQWSSMFVSVRWTQTVVYVILIGYLSWISLKQSTFYTKLRSSPARAVTGKA
jgi:branched-chain amino acid transport system permease protein